MVYLSVKFLLIAATVIILVILLANVELYFNKRNSIYVVELSKDCVVLLPKNTGFMDPVYIYNPKKIKKRDLSFEIGYNERNYIKKSIYEHIASKISKPLKELGNVLMSIPKSKTPLNTLYSTIGKSGEIMSTMTPTSYDPSSGYKMLTSIRDSAEAFVAGNKLYVLG